MAETKNTSRGSTGYTSWHAHTWTTTYDVDSNLRVRCGPGTGYAEVNRIYPGYTWYIAESLWGWGREPNRDWWSSLDFMTAGGTMDPTPGEFRVDSIDIQATRNNPWDKNLTVKYTIKSSNAAGTTESYYDWRVYCYAAKINGGEVQGDLYNRSRSIGGNGRWTHTFTYTIEETSTNSSVSLGNYGIWYTGNGSYRSIDGGVGQQLTFDIPPYNPKVVPKCTAINYSNRTDTSINITGTFDNGKGTIDKYRFKYKKDGGGWVELAETTSNSASLSSLTPNTKYWVGAKAHNEIGWGNYKEDSYFFTKPKANKPIVSASDIKHNSFKINVTKNSTNYPDINYYGASYKKGPIREIDSLTALTNQSSSSFTLSGLTPNTPYIIVGRTRTKNGLDGSTSWSPDSDKVVVITSPKVGTSSVSCVKNNTTNSLSIKVTPSNNTYRNIGKAGDVDGNGTINNNDRTVLSSYLIGETNLTYDQLLRTDVDRSGFITVNDSAQIQLHILGSGTNNKIGKDMKIPTGDYHPIADTYQVRYRKSGTATWTNSSTSTNQTITLSSLTAGDTYEIQGRSRTAEGYNGQTAWSAWSSSISVRVVRKPVIEGLEYNNTGKSKEINLRVVYKNDYPAANRIYYAVVPQTITTNPGKINGMYFSTTGSPATINITKDYQGNALLPNTKYYVWIYVNQYKAASDWYTAGLDLYSAVEKLPVVTLPDIGTLKNVKCIQNNTYNSLTFTATKEGTWSKYVGWEYRYKRASDIEYSYWSGNPDPNNKTISNLLPGEIYNIQIRGSTGSVNDSMTYNSKIYELTVRVVRKPKMNVTLVRLKENEIGINGVITDKGYPEVTSLDWEYSSNSFINSTYVPNTWINFKTITFGASINTNQDIVYTNLYHFAMYNIRAKLTQYKTGAQWYTAGINHSFDFDINNIELAMYNSRTSRLKSNNSGWKQVKDLRCWDGTQWKTSGTNIEPTSLSDNSQIWGKLYWDDNVIYINNFYHNGAVGGGNQAVKEAYEVWVPGIDRIRWKGKTSSDHAYGGNLFDNKLELDLTKIPVNPSDTNQLRIKIPNKYEYKISKNSVSIKLKNNDTSIYLYDDIFGIFNINKVLNLDLIDTLYIEYCTDVIPVGGDLNEVPSFDLKSFTNETSVNNQSGGGLIRYDCNLSDGIKRKHLDIVPISIIENVNLGYSLNSLEMFNQTGYTHAGNRSNLKTKGSILNISNFNIYYTLM